MSSVSQSPLTPQGIQPAAVPSSTSSTTPSKFLTPTMASAAQGRAVASSSAPPRPNASSASSGTRFKYDPMDMLLPHERAQRAKALASNGGGNGGQPPSTQGSGNYRPVVGSSSSSHFGSGLGGPSTYTSQYHGGVTPSSARVISPQPLPASSSYGEPWVTRQTSPYAKQFTLSNLQTISDHSNVVRASRVTSWETGMDIDGEGPIGSNVRSRNRPTGGSANDAYTQRGISPQGIPEGSHAVSPREGGLTDADVDMEGESPEVEVTVNGERLPAKLSDWELVETLGTGTFGRVVLARVRPPWRSTSYHPIFPHLIYSADPLEPTPEATAGRDANRPHYAMKILAKSEIVRLKQVEHINNELAILKKIRHPFIVELYAAYQDHLNVYMILSYHSGGELFSHLRRAGRFSIDVSRYYIATVALALAYLHRLGIVFRDIKPENILIGDDGYVRLCDFGFAKHVGHEATFTLCGTPDYLAPEIVLSKGHGLAVDLWSLGILTYELLVGYPPFFADNPLRTYERILESKVVFPAHVDHYARSFIRGLLQPDLSKRLGNLKGGTEDILDHPFFAGVDWDILEGRQITPPIIPARMSRGDCQNFQRYPPPAVDEMPGVVGIQPAPGFRDPYASLFTQFTFPARG